jgi:hypothetical protein
VKSNTNTIAVSPLLETVAEPLMDSYPGRMDRCDAAADNAITICLAGRWGVSISEDTRMRRDRDGRFQTSIKGMKGQKWNGILSMS